MDFRKRRYWVVKLPYGPEHNNLIRIIKSIPHVKVHPAKWPSVKMDSQLDPIHCRFEDEESARQYYNIMVSVWGWYETRCLLYVMSGFATSDYVHEMGYFEILPRNRRKKNENN